MSQKKSDGSSCAIKLLKLLPGAGQQSSERKISDVKMGKIRCNSWAGPRLLLHDLNAVCSTMKSTVAFLFVFVNHC